MTHNFKLPRRVYIETVLGACNRRSLDAQRMATFFRVNGYKVVSNPKYADLLMLITCGVTLDREANSIRRIHSLKKFGGELIVCGCLPAINGQLVSSAHRGKIIDTSKIGDIDNIFPNESVKFSDLKDANFYFSSYESIFGFKFWQVLFAKIRTLRWTSIGYVLKQEVPRLIKKTLGRLENGKSAPFSIRISWGCNQKCAYCGIRSAVGKFHSKPMETCLEEFSKGVAEGHKVIELIADDVGAYGLDINQNFPELLNLLFETKGSYNVLIWNLSPVWFIKNQAAFLPILRKGRICEIHYPIQSGSSRILKAMNRFSNISRIRESVLAMKEQRAGLLVTTDIIVGYPGETDEDISETINLLLDVHFDNVYIFLFNDVINTLPYTLGTKVPRDIAWQRINRVQRELERIGIDYLIIV